MKFSIAQAALLLSAQATLVLGFYDKRDAVVELNSNNFRSQVLDTNKLTAVEFYAPWCGHCQKLTPEWKKAANNLKGLVTVAAVNCDEEANRPVCSQYGIQGFPTIKIFRPERNKKGSIVKKPTDYQGPREAKPLVDHLLSVLPSEVRFVKDNAEKVKSQKSISIEDFLAKDNSTLPKALLFTDKSATTPLYKALSADFANRMLMGEVKKSEKDVMEIFGVQSFPTLVVITPENGSIKYDGKLKHEALHNFLSKYALAAEPTQKKPQEKEKEKEKEKPAKKETQAPAPLPTVEEIVSDEVLGKHCLDTGNICVIAIVQEDKDETLAMFKALNEASSNPPLFRFGWMTDLKATQIMDKLDLVHDFPTLFILHPGKKLYRPYIGAWDQEKIKRWLGDISSGKVSAWPYKGALTISNSDKQWRDEL
ncbi:hypothetical protein J3Q64DRAFT_1725209 [Phycomyces blakesleeanus]|uniref:protein disulfide-isomerase n=2 Tax=Phycomyces blakesleeanus TaxID=4837 RepID=A0A163EPN2_PHYB8|nr:hypothetical protein PHYBLDRAFT_184400 [Phycomyces blakesleeanus NRRL 1555(-)]OAD80670.1 hypothetical protein PHYBLDRAFT_184400 [Phycomyces blakesleeanus NRRL 1555(-)]|eukprot:XP_018298710.1 hypothetical protein PHYBLDRAFT_184400 [Phycomyces blakesleeanus NRRL 1555(-)]